MRIQSICLDCTHNFFALKVKPAGKAQINRQSAHTARTKVCKFLLLIHTYADR